MTEVEFRVGYAAQSDLSTVDPSSFLRCCSVESEASAVTVGSVLIGEGEGRVARSVAPPEVGDGTLGKALAERQRVSLADDQRVRTHDEAIASRIGSGKAKLDCLLLASVGVVVNVVTRALDAVSQFGNHVVVALVHVVNPIPDLVSVHVAAVGASIAHSLPCHVDAVALVCQFRTLRILRRVNAYIDLGVGGTSLALGSIDLHHIVVEAVDGLVVGERQYAGCVRRLVGLEQFVVAQHLHLGQVVA